MAGDKTEINSFLGTTEINMEVGQATAINQDIAAASRKLSAGVILLGKYEVVEPLKVSTGEADLYICECGGRQYVAKMYRRQRAVKPEVLTALKSITSPYVASLYDMGRIRRPAVCHSPILQKRKPSGKEIFPEGIKGDAYTLYQ